MQLFPAWIPLSSSSLFHRIKGEGGRPRPARAALVAQAGGPGPAWPSSNSGTDHVRLFKNLKTKTLVKCEFLVTLNNFHVHLYLDSLLEELES